MAGTVPAGSRAAPGTMHPLPPSRGERLGTALLPCWQQGHLHTASVPHRRKVLPMGVQPRDPETTPEGLMSREMVAQGWGLVSLRSPQGRLGGQELIPGTQAAFPGGFPGTKGCPARLRAGEGRHPQAAPPAAWVPRGDSPTPRGLPGVPHTHGHQHKRPLQHPPTALLPQLTHGGSPTSRTPRTSLPRMGGGGTHTPLPTSTGRTPRRRGQQGGTPLRDAAHAPRPDPSSRTHPPTGSRTRAPRQFAQALRSPNAPKPPQTSPGPLSGLPHLHPRRAPSLPWVMPPRTKAAGAPWLLTGARCLGGCFWARLAGPCRGSPPWCRCRRTAAGRRRRGGPGRARRKPGARRRPAAPPGPPPPPRGSGSPPWQRE